MTELSPEIIQAMNETGLAVLVSVFIPIIAVGIILIFDIIRGE